MILTDNAANLKVLIETLHSFNFTSRFTDNSPHSVKWFLVFNLTFLTFKKVQYRLNKPDSIFPDSDGKVRDYLIDLDGQLVRKFSKRPFLKDILISFQWVTQMGLETPQFFLFKIFQQIRSLEAFKILAKMGRGWQAD